MEDHPNWPDRHCKDISASRSHDWRRHGKSIAGDGGLRHDFIYTTYNWNSNSSVFLDSSKSNDTSTVSILSVVAEGNCPTSTTQIARTGSPDPDQEKHVVSSRRGIQRKPDDSHQMKRRVRALHFSFFLFRPTTFELTPTEVDPLLASLHK